MVSLGAIDKSTTTKIRILRKYLLSEKIIKIIKKKKKSLYVPNDQDFFSLLQINDAFSGQEVQFKKKGYVFKSVVGFLAYSYTYK